MDKISSSDFVLTTPKGKLRIRSFCSPKEIRKFTFNREFTFQAHYKSLITCRELLENAISSSILKMMVAHPRIEEKIVYMVGYCWTWDLSGTRKTAQLYRQMLINLFEPYGFKEYETNEPNICLKSENLFMCRMGNNLSQAIRDRFKWLRFGLSPWTWKVNEI